MKVYFSKEVNLFSVTNVCEATKAIHSTKKFILFKKYCMTIQKSLHYIVFLYKLLTSTAIKLFAEATNLICYIAIYWWGW